MNKFFLLIICWLPLSVAAQSLTDPHQKDLLGQGHLNAGINLGGTVGTVSTGLAQYVAPRLQYFVKDGWSVAIEGRQNINSPFLRYVGLGLDSRYYFIRDRRLALFGQVGGNIGQSRFSQAGLEASVHNVPLVSSSFEENTAWQVTGGVGLAFRVATRWSVEVLGERARTQVNPVLSYQSWQGSLGLNFQLK